jgi:ribosomal protein S18 acetylase RimI-like enzyme
LRFTGARLAALDLGCARQIFSIYGFFGAFGMVWRNKVLGGTKEADKNEYLIAHLAVDPRFRRQGIAKSLIECAVSETQTHGFSRLVLEVEIGNEPAINLYKKMGFSVVHTREFKQYSALLSCPGFHKMLKIIKGVCDGE